MLSVITAVFSVATIIASGGALSGFLRVYYELPPQKRKEVAATAWGWYGIGSGIVVFFSLLLARSLSLLLFHSVKLCPLFVLGGISFALLNVKEFLFSLLRAERKAFAFITFSIFQTLVGFGLKWLFLLTWRRGVAGYLESTIITQLFMLPFILCITSRYLAWKFDFSLLKKILHLGYPFMISGLSMWTMERADRIILNAFKGAEAVGIYSLAGEFVRAFNIVLTYPWGMFWAPFIFSFASRSSEAETKNLLARTLVLLLGLNGFIYLLIVLGCEGVVRVLTPNRMYWKAEEVVPIFLLSPFFYNLSRPAGTALLIAKRPSFVAFSAWVAAISNVVLDFLLIPRWGVIGAASATAFSSLLFSLQLYGRNKFVYPFNFRIKQLLICSLGILTGYLIGNVALESCPIVEYVGRRLGGIIVFALLAWRALVGDGERK